MLTKELLTTIEGLTDEQMSKIAELSQNDENQVIAAKIREVHDMYDKDIFEATGLQKPTGEKSYGFLKRILGDFKEQANIPENLKSEIDKLRDANKDLEAKIKQGTTDEAIKQKLTDNETLISKLREDLRNQQKSHEQSLLEKEGELASFKLKSIQDLADIGLKFKGDFNDKTLQYHREGARQEAMAIGTPEISEVDGKQAIIFRDENGNIITDDDNLRKPLTYQQRYKNLLAPVLDVDSKVSGTGQRGVDGKRLIGGGNWSTKTEATRAISKELLSEGYKLGTQEYDTKLTEMYQAYNIAELPLR